MGGEQCGLCGGTCMGLERLREWLGGKRKKARQDKEERSERRMTRKRGEKGGRRTCEREGVEEENVKKSKD